jgi:adenylate kinase
MSGLALVNLEDAILEEPNALSMLIDIFSERGYCAVVDVRNDPIPESVDPKTYQIKTCIKTVYRIQIRFPRSKIRNFTT